MKKKLKMTLYAFVLMICIPFTVLLTGCGATPSDEVLGVYFVSENYDDATGYAVFEVDLNVATKLEYKLNPSSGSGYKATYGPKDTLVDNRSKFKLDQNGIIVVNDPTFQQILVDITVNGHKDTCIVKLKQYPSDIFLYDETGNEVQEMDISINAMGTYTICTYGRFTHTTGEHYGEKYIDTMLDSEFNYKVVSSDPTIVDVPLSNRLKINAVTRKPSKATVTIYVLNTVDEVIEELKINVKVVIPASRSSVLINGKTFVENGESLTIDKAALSEIKDADKNVVGYGISYQIFTFNEEDRYIEPKYVEFDARVNNDNYVKLVNGQVEISAHAPTNLEFDLIIGTSLVDDNGLPYIIKLHFTIV